MRAACLGLETLTVMLVAFALSLAALAAWARSPDADVRLDLTLTEDCGDGVAIYRDRMGTPWIWRGALKPAPLGASCVG